MNAKAQHYAKYTKFFLYALVVVLINWAGLTLFTRTDLTHNDIYSLSPVSKKVVATLTEPLTVKVFFTKDLPAPHNSTELYLHDLLNEYALNNRKYFKVHFYNVSAETEGVSEEARVNQQMARDYGIYPVQIQMVEKDELKFKQAYLGMVLIHGDIVERIPTITSTEGLEYKLTTAIQKLNHKVSALLALDSNIEADLVLSSSLSDVAPSIGIKDLKQYPDQIKAVIEKMSAKTYHKLVFKRVDPSKDPDAAKILENQHLMRLKWPEGAFPGISAGEGTVGMLLRYKDQTREIPLLRVVRLPIFGDQYQLTPVDQIEELVNTNLDRIINNNEEIGYLAGFGTPDIGTGNPLGPRDDTLSRFSALLNKSYNVKTIDLNQEPVPEGLKCLIIAGPTQKFSDYALYQIDQALMRGTNIALFMDAFEMKQAQSQGPFMANTMPTMVPLDTGLEKLLAHYGIRIKKSIVMDEECYRQRMPQNQGGGEQPVYFIPVIKNDNIDKQLDFMKSIKGLIAFQVSPLEKDAKQIEAQKLHVSELFSSSDHSWEARDNIILDPRFIQPPSSDSEMAKQPLAYLLEGSFSSYYKGKPMPEKPVEKKEDEKSAAGEKPAADAQPPKGLTQTDLSKVTGEGVTREQSPPAKIFVIASSKMIGDQLLDEEGQSPNSMFVLNMIDALNGHEAIAAMRSKSQRFNPLEETGATSKAAIKAVNIAGLPILVVLAGLLVWWQRHLRRKKIQMMFQG